MPSLFYAGQPDYIEKLNTLATAASMTNGTVAASFLSLAVTGTATAASFVGPLTGNASTATTLATARNINGVSFNGSADITVTAAAGTLTGATLAAGVTASSLTSVGTLTALTVSGQSSFAAGTAAAPSLKVGAEQNGLYSSAANTLDVTLGGVRQFQFAHTASAVNYAAVYGSATGVRPLLLMSGSDANIGVNFAAKGTGDILFTGGGASYTLLQIAGGAAGTVNYPLLTAATTGGNVTYGVAGSDTNVDLTLGTQGSGAFDFLSHGALTRQFRIASVASATNYWQAQGNVTSGAPTLFATGVDTNVNALYSTKGTGEHFFYSGGAANLQFKVGHVANAVNRVTAYGNATGGAPSLFAEGSDINISFGLYSKGSGGVFAAVRGAVSAYFDNPASAVNYWSVSGSAAGGFSNILEALGTDANIQNLYASKGTYGHMFRTNGSGGQTQFLIAHAPSAVNYYQVQGAATAGAPVFFATGSDTNVSAIYSLKGAGNHVFYTATTTAPQFVVSHTASAVNYPQVTGSATGNAVTAAAAGSDSNIDFAITPKGTGVLRFGTHSALAAETVTGYITIKDAAGNSRKLAVLS